MTNPIPAWQDMDLAMRIRVLMAVRGVTMKDVASAAGISQPTMSKLARGAGAPNLDTARRLATAFELEHIEDLVPVLAS